MENLKAPILCELTCNELQELYYAVNNRIQMLTNDKYEIEDKIRELGELSDKIGEYMLTCKDAKG